MAKRFPKLGKVDSSGDSCLARTRKAIFRAKTARALAGKAHPTQLNQGSGQT
ncbi:hypothetical protein [Microseira sp. BLCC-F43]|uniref:hypothetical protein n=1 Tax=Microseira sp. BLCC-F43 TaxID=3153602 RepID=UPI0035B7F925